MNSFIERFTDASRTEMKAYVATIAQGARPLATIRAGLEAQCLAQGRSCR